MKRGMSAHRRPFNAVYTVNDFYFLYIPFRFLTERRTRQILCRVYTRAVMLERPVMKRDAQRFTRAITTKVTNADFKQLEQLWNESGMTRSEWCRKALLNQASLITSNGNPYTLNEITLLLAELLALRTITVNLLHCLGSGETISREKLGNLTELADREKFRRAIDRLQQIGKK
jgi:hypothetical protein